MVKPEETARGLTTAQRKALLAAHPYGSIYAALPTKATIAALMSGFPQEHLVSPLPGKSWGRLTDLGREVARAAMTMEVPT